MLYKLLISKAKNPCFGGRCLEKVEPSRLVAMVPVAALSNGHEEGTCAEASHRTELATRFLA